MAQLLLLQAWSPDNPTYAGGNGVTWSLSVEMFFYLAFPLAIVLLRRLSGRGLAVTAAVTLALMALLPLIVTLAGVNSYSNLYYWLFFVFPSRRWPGRVCTHPPVRAVHPAAGAPHLVPARSAAHAQLPS